MIVILYFLFQVLREIAAIMASDEQFSLCWNNFHANMSAGFHGLLSRGDLVDVTLAAEGRLLQAHKLVLSVCSPYFQEMFKLNPTQHPIGKHTFKQILRFPLKTGSVYMLNIFSLFQYF